MMFELLKLRSPVTIPRVMAVQLPIPHPRGNIKWRLLCDTPVAFNPYGTIQCRMYFKIWLASYDAMHIHNNDLNDKIYSRKYIKALIMLSIFVKP